MSFYFLNATDAAAELNRLESQRRWTPAQVLYEAKAGRLPVCFNFAGELVAHSVDGKRELEGKSPSVLDFDGVVRSLTPPSANGVRGFGILVEIQEAHKVKFSRKDGARTRGIDLPTESPHGGRIKAGHKVECWLEDADIPTDAFLFRDDDLAKLVTATQAAQATPAPETLPSANSNALEARTKAKPRARVTLEDFLMPYIVKVFRSGTYRSGKELHKALVSCRVPDHCIDSKRYPLFMAREAMAGLIEQLKASGGSKS